MDEATMKAMGKVWPRNEDVDEFLAWLDELRHPRRSR
jgi:hypothetical protein